MIRSSAPGFYHKILKPVVKSIAIDKEVIRLLDKWEEDGNCSHYDKAVYLAKKSSKLMGYSN